MTKKEEGKRPELEGEKGKYGKGEVLRRRAANRDKGERATFKPVLHKEDVLFPGISKGVREPELQPL